MKATTLEKITVSLLIILTIVDGGLYIAFKRLTDTLANNPEIIMRGDYKASVATPLLSFSKDGKEIEQKSLGAGVVVRFAAKDCHFCLQDQPAWGSLSSKLSDSGYRIVILVPSPTEEYAAGAEAIRNAQQAPYISMEWISKFKLRITPTLLIFDTKGNLLWHHEGILNPQDSASAIRAANMSRF